MSVARRSDAFVADCEVVEGEGGHGEREGAEAVEKPGGAREEEVGKVGLWEGVRRGLARAIWGRRTAWRAEEKKLTIP